MSFEDNFILAFQFYVQGDRFTQTYAVSAIKLGLQMVSTHTFIKMFEN